VKHHLAFGSGNHFCMGAQLARLQLQILFTEILSRLPDIAVVGPPDYLDSLWFHGINKMEVEFTPQ
jgi:cytochrome P450